MLLQLLASLAMGRSERVCPQKPLRSRDPRGFLLDWNAVTNHGEYVAIRDGGNSERKDYILVFAFCDGTMEILADFPQDKPVFVHKLLCQDTVEERIHKLQQEKGKLAAGTLADADISNAATVRALLSKL